MTTISPHKPHTDNLLNSSSVTMATQPSLSIAMTTTSTLAKGSTSSNVCAVCNDVSPPNSIFRRHYGVVCCEACKCFFRRTVQMGRDYKCRYANTCPVGRNTINIKQVCQACRFNRCTNAGMKIESVKKFPRKPKDLKNPTGVKLTAIKGIKKKTLSSCNGGIPLLPSNNHHKIADASLKKEATTTLSDELDYDENELDLFKFNISSPGLGSRAFSSSGSSGVDTMPKLFSGESLENIHEKSSIPTPESVSGDSLEKQSPQVVVSGGVVQSERSPLVSEGVNKDMGVVRQASPLVQVSHGHAQHGMTELSPGQHVAMATKRTNSGGVNFNEMLMKRQRLEDALNHITARQMQVQTNLQRLSVSVASNQHHISSTHQYTHSMYPNEMGVQVKQEHGAYATPHGTPHGTPAHSPLPSPHVVGPYHSSMHYHSSSQPATPHPSATPQNMSQPGTPLNNSVPSSPLGVGGHYGNYFFQNQSQVMYNQPSIIHSGSAYSAPPPLCVPPSSNNPFSHINFKGNMSSLPNSTVTSPVSTVAEHSEPFLSPSFTHDSEGKLAVAEIDSTLSHYPLSLGPHHDHTLSTTSSTCPSPILKPSKTIASDTPEAQVEEVLDSLKRRIRYIFKWAKSEVKDFDDLSPLDQKALLRRTIPELVMLVFARSSIAYKDMLLLGSTGKVIRPTNSNSGVAAVALVTLTKLVVPLKVLNIDDHELNLMQEIVLFNPESNCLCSRETVREYRRQKHIELMEYCSRTDPGRFGELLCLLTPLYEVSLEVTEQLRLEQFVHEGEARIDALLLMSMINQGGGASEEPIEGSD